jgi:virginiamycin B lyase
MEEIFPPGPGLDLLKENCTGCHADTPGGWGAMRFTKERYLSGVEQMFETGPGFNAYTMALGHTPVNKQQKEMIAEYLAKNFGPGSIEKRLRLDPMPYDEEVTSKAIYVSYDLPVDLPFAPGGPKPLAPMINGYIAQSPPPNPRHHLGNTYISPVDGNIWHSSRGSSSILRLNPKERDPLARWTNYPIIGDPYVHPDGVSVNKQGHVFFAELRTGRLGELRPENGTMIRHALPMQTGALHEAIVDKDGNVGFDFVWGAAFGRMEAKTGKIHLYPTPTPDNGLYGLAFDQQGNMWASGWQKGTINKWDLATESVKEYKVPNSWGQMRRIGVDSKGIVWSTEYITGMVARLDPATGEISEIKIPYSGAKPYDSWPDKEDNIWMGDQAHNAIVKYDQKTKKFAYFPMPQPGQSINKFQMEENNTIWFGSRSVPVVTSVHFYPDGYTAKAPPVP